MTKRRQHHIAFAVSVLVRGMPIHHACYVYGGISRKTAVRWIRQAKTYDAPECEVLRRLDPCS